MRDVDTKPLTLKLLPIGAVVRIHADLDALC